MGRLLLNTSEDQFKFFIFFVCMHTHVYVVCTPSVHAHGSETSLTLHLVLCDEIYHWPGISPWYLAVSSQHWGHRCILQFLPFSCVLAIQLWVLMFAQWAQYPLSHLTKPKDQFLWVKYRKSSCLLISQVGSCFVDNFYTSLK